MKVLDLFSGIGGFSLGLERAGMKTVAFCENDRWCQAVLKKHWPDTTIHNDVKKMKYKDGKLACFGSNGSTLHTVDIDLICGGFPCQDISVGGLQKGIIDGDRSSIWKHYWRLIREIRPKYAIIENVERLRKNGLGIVLNDLSEIGYNAEWHCITARAIGLPHQRDRVWIIAHRSGERPHEYIGEKRHIQINEKRQSEEIYTERKQRQFKPGEVCTILSRGAIDSARDANAHLFSALPGVRRVVDGVPSGLDEDLRKERIKMLGNSIVPQIAELIGRAIMEHEV